MKRISFFIALMGMLAFSAIGNPVYADGTNYIGKVVKTANSSALYYVAADGHRYVFPNAKIYNTWFTDFSDITEITSSELATIQLGGNVMYRPGVVLIKIQTDPKIYAVSQNRMLRWVKTEAIAKALYGDNWNLLVDDVEDSFFANYTVGDPIEYASGYSPAMEVQQTQSIDANHNLAQTHARLGNTGVCKIETNGQNRTRTCASTGSVQGEQTMNDPGSAPHITAIEVTNGGEKGYLDQGDTISIYFNESVKATAINQNLTVGGTVSGITPNETGGVRVSSNGEITIENIATFDMGSVDFSETFVSSLALNTYGNVLTITLTGGSDIEIFDENFTNAEQIGGTIEDNDGIKMANNYDIADPTGTFGGAETDSPYITSIRAYNGGDDGYIDKGDRIVVTFSEAIDPESIHDDLVAGDRVDNVSYARTGGLRVSSSGKVTINDIAAFDMGSVDFSETYTSRLELSSDARTLTILITGGSDVEILNENFDNASQFGNTVTSKDGVAMEDKSHIDDPEGSFGGAYFDDSGRPYITEIEVDNGGETGFIDQGDTITISFNEAIDPKTVHENLTAGGSVSNVLYSETGGVSVSSSGNVIVSDITIFSMGDAGYSGVFISKLSLSTNGKELTITLTGGGDIEITYEDLNGASQLGNIIEDLDGNAMENESIIDDPIGTFGGDYEDNNDADRDPYITGIEIFNGGETGYIDTGDYLVVHFNEAIEPNSIHYDLDNGDYVTDVSYAETGGVRVSSSGQVTINDIASFDMGAVEDSETYSVRLALSSNSKDLTITLTGGQDIEITDESFGDAQQNGGTIEDQDGNEMNSDSSISDPTGTFGGALNTSSSGDKPRITSIEVVNGGSMGYIDVGDTITITFSEPINAESINPYMNTGDYITNISPLDIGGVTVYPGGAVVIEKIATFDVGSVSTSGNYVVSLDQSSDGESITIKLTSGSPIYITTKDFNNASQIGGTLADRGDNEMADSSLGRPQGSF